MLSSDKVDIVSDFFLDGAKIVFTSLVVGVFVPGTTSSIPWFTFIIGLVLTAAFLSMAVELSKKENAKS